jgi:hypothetical protein
MSKKDEYVKKMQAQLDEWSKDIDVLKAKADKAKAAAKDDYHKMVEDLRTRQKAGAKKLAELKKASDDTWEDLKKDVKSAWDSIEKTLKSTTAKFK